VVGGLHVHQREGRGGIWIKNPKLSICGSVSGVLCKTAVWGNTGRWWVRVNGGEVVGGLRVRQREGRDGIWVKNPKSSIRGSVSGMLWETAAWKDGEGLC
jgi:hypothetical protein